MGKGTRTPLDRLKARLDRSGECWIWTGAQNGNGYGQIGVAGTRSPALPHRLAYELLVGPIPDGLTIDHLCRNRLCCNPAHLEAVSQKQNVHRARDFRLAERAGMCPSGRHEMTAENTYVRPGGYEACRECTYEHNRAWKARQSKPETCSYGHLLSGDNLILRKNGRRNCAICEAARIEKVRQSHQRRRAA